MKERSFTVRGAQVIDGSGSKASRADVLVIDGVITKVGSIRGAKRKAKLSKQMV